MLLAGALAAACSLASASTSSGRDEPPQSAIELPGAVLTIAGANLALLSESPPALYPQLLIARRAEPSGATDTATLILPYTDALVYDWNITDETRLGIFAQNTDSTWRWIPALINGATNTAVARVDPQSTAWAVGPSWMMVPWQERSIIGAEFAPGERNVLVIHGWNGEPWDGCILQLEAGIGPTYDNVAALAYPSALDIADTSLWLRSEIERRWPDMPFDIIGFSEGGLIARAAIEPHAWNGDKTIDARIGRLIAIATPHEGILANAPPSVLNDAATVQMRPDSDFLLELNNDPRHDGVTYDVIAGDLGRGDDGIVPTTSALGENVLEPHRSAILRLPHSVSGTTHGLPCEEQVYDEIAAGAH